MANPMKRPRQAQDEGDIHSLSMLDGTLHCVYTYYLYVFAGSMMKIGKNISSPRVIEYILYFILFFRILFIINFLFKSEIWY